MMIEFSRSSSHPRDYDLAIAEQTARAVESRDEHFILTGSYSIEALTHDKVAHNDIDANIFTQDVPRAIARVGLILANNEILPNATRIEHTKPDRLEYSIETPAGARDLELQFVAFEEALTPPNSVDFKLGSTATRDIVVPTVTRTLETTKGESMDFRVKSLPYAIATWALRISGIATAQKRPVRQSDIDHFAFLAAAPHNADEVIRAIIHHPQMPEDASPGEVLLLALNQIDKS